MKHFIPLAGIFVLFGLVALGCDSVTSLDTNDSAFGPTASSTTGMQTVTESNVGQDWFENLAADGDVTFTTEFGAPAGFGSGALKLTTGATNPSRAQLNSPQDAGMLLADIDAVSYWTFKSSASTGAQAQGPALNIGITNTGADGTGGFSTLVFEPIYTPGYGGNAAYGTDEWKEWDASGEARWWCTGSNVPGCNPDTRLTFDAILAGNPHAVILGYAVNLGTWNPNIVAAVDGFTIGSKTFNFEPAPPQPTSISDCQNGGWQQYGFRNQGQCIRYVNTGQDSR